VQKDCTKKNDAEIKTKKLWRDDVMTALNARKNKISDLAFVAMDAKVKLNSSVK